MNSIFRTLGVIIVLSISSCVLIDFRQAFSAEIEPTADIVKERSAEVEGPKIGEPVANERNISNHRTDPFYLSICAKVGARVSWYLDEWITFHLIAGVEHFFLGLDPKIDLETAAVIDRWANRSIVTLISYDHDSVDADICPDGNHICLFYIQCYKQVSFRTRWMSLIDTDEFIIPIEGCSIVDALMVYCPMNLPSVHLWWTVFGSSNKTNRYKGANLVTEDFQQSGGACNDLCAPHHKWCGECRHSKAIVNTDCASDPRHAGNHWVARLDLLPKKCWQPFGLQKPSRSDKMLNHQASLRCTKSFELNHYAVLSKAEFEYRRGWNGSRTQTFDQERVKLRDLNSHHQDLALKFSHAIRDVLQLGDSPEPLLSRTALAYVPDPSLNEQSNCPTPEHILQKSLQDAWFSPEIVRAMSHGLPPPPANHRSIFSFVDPSNL